MAPGDENLQVEEVLNLSLYDQADPNNLYLASVDKAKFEKLQARQNLTIEQFSAFSCHFQSLLNNCIDQQEGQFVCALKNIAKSRSAETD